MSARRAVKKEQTNGGDLFAKPALKLDSLDEIRYLELRVVQHFSGHQIPKWKGSGKNRHIVSYVTLTPFCDMRDCPNHAVVMICQPDHKGWRLCLDHRNELGVIKDA